MSAIDELKSGVENQEKKPTKINMITGAPKRSAVSDITVQNAIGLPEDDLKKTDTNQTYVESILDVDNPESMFRQHYDEKLEEAKEWVAAKQEEEAEKEFEEKYGDDEEDIEIKEEDLKEASEEIEEDLSNPVMTSSDLSKSDIITMDITNNNTRTPDGNLVIDATSDVEEADEGLNIDATVNVDDIKEDTKVEEKKIEEKEPEYTSDVDIEMHTSKEERKIESEETEDEVADTDDEDAAFRDENMKRVQKIVAERLKPASLGLDLSSFTIAKKAEINAKEIFDSYKARVSKWVAMNQESVIYMREFSGAELEKLMEYYNAYSSSVRLARRYETATVDTRSAKQMYQMIYDHLEGPKPANFNTWLKLTPVSDIDNYFFSIYISSFMGANFIPIDCGECKKSYVTEDINIMDNMVKFPTQEARDKFTNIYNSNNIPATKGIYTTEVVPLTNMVAIGFKEPSIDDMIAINEVDKKTQTEFSNIITFLPYIDNLYKIDVANHTLIPIGYKKYDSESKNIRSKLRKYEAVFTSIGIDAFSPVKAYITALDQKTSRGINYVLPETTCPECGHVNPEIPIGNGEVADMVFTRCQLGALVSTSIN